MNNKAIAVLVGAVVVVGGVAYYVSSSKTPKVGSPATINTGAGQVAENTASNAPLNLAPDTSANEPQPSVDTNVSDVGNVVPQPTTSATVKAFTVTGQNFSFSPSEIRVKKGDTVRIIFKNDVGFHDWSLDEFNAATKTISGGDQDTIEFVASKTGTFEYYCSVGSHRAMGMKGSFVVEE